MSKQYLAQHTIDDAHPSDIFCLATTPHSVLSGSGSSSIKVHDTTSPEFPISQVLTDAHKLGVHHVITSPSGNRAVSVGFGGEVKIWRFAVGKWDADGVLEGVTKKAGEVWAVALSSEGRYLAGTTADGRVSVWDLGEEGDGKEAGTRERIREYETKGSFGLCVDLSADGRFTATGHSSGSIYVFSNATTRLLHALPTLAKPVRAVRFSPGSTLLAAAGDARVVSIYDPSSGEQVANLSGHQGWITSLDWSFTGQYILSGGVDGKVKVWDLERRACVATHSESEAGIWAVKWLPKGETSVERAKSERFVAAGAGKSIAIYREATGG